MSNFIKKSQTTTVHEHGISSFIEYGLPFNRLAVGVSEINGRYPANGCGADTEIEQVWYIESGNGIIGVEDQEYSVGPGDMLLIEPSQNYWILGDHLKLVVSSTPPWNSEQHKHIPM